MDLPVVAVGDGGYIWHLHMGCGELMKRLSEISETFPYRQKAFKSPEINDSIRSVKDHSTGQFIIVKHLCIVRTQFARFNMRVHRRRRLWVGVPERPLGALRTVLPV